MSLPTLRNYSHHRSVWWSPAALLLAVTTTSQVSAAEPTIDFARDVRPILSNTCFTCHGPDGNQRVTDLRFDLEASAKSPTESGIVAITPENPAASELYTRITSTDPDVQMPPPDQERQLTAAQKETLKTWIAEGAVWEGHWSFTPPKRPVPPEVAETKTLVNEIDAFVIDRLTKAGLEPAPEADRETLIRRVTLDLTGLPPTIAEIDAFLADESPEAYERVVDRLLDSPRYGEHMARYWLDAARYGDTHGLHLDNERSMWPYRNWVIDAFNDNKPFDEFTVEQLAGDLLPEPSLAQQIATGFNRCNVTTSEGGSIAEEYRVRYAVDRVETTATVWLGLTAGCAVCHDHKYDPLTQNEFYGLFAYFANTEDRPMDGNALLPPPAVKAPTPEQSRRLAELDESIARTESDIEKALRAIEYVEPTDGQPESVPEPVELVWIDDELPVGAVAQGNEGAESWAWGEAAEYPVFSGKQSHRRTADGLSQHFFTGANPPLEVTEHDVFFTYVFLDPQNPPEEIMLQFNDGSWEHRAYWGGDKISWGATGSPSRFSKGPLPQLGEWVRLEVPVAEVGFKDGTKINGWAFTQFGGTVFWDKAGVQRQAELPSHFHSFNNWLAAQTQIKGRGLPETLVPLFANADGEHSVEQLAQLKEHFLEHAWTGSKDTFEPLHKQVAALRKERDDLDKAIPSTLVMKEKKDGRLETFVLTRGEYDKPDKDRQVTAGTPSFLPALPPDAAPDRLSLAKWIIDESNPLTARVTVNRFWQRYFGTGLVETTEDFGSQGIPPSHPKLLDWLAVEFIESGWDVKHMQKLIVMSASYRQSSRVTEEKLKIDPANRLLSRGPRFRMDAEMVRDQALFVSGLLVEKIGGASVKPYQPGGLWEVVGYTDSNTAKFKRDDGIALYRRSMYTFWKRTSPPPSMAIFDAPSRESCTVRRPRTNTPMQALTLMNDVQFVEAARAFAERILREGGTSPADKATFAFRTVVGRVPRPAELDVLVDQYQRHAESFANDAAAAEELLSIGEASRDSSLPATDAAAWTMVANLILNLDAAVSKF